jgi:hypothetical protein
MVQKELCESLRILYILRRVRISTPLSYLLAFSGIGQWFTEVGRHHWIIVARKYILFCLACLGIWVNETYKAYGIDVLVKKFTIREPEEATMEFIKLIIASRVILLQALGPTTTLISIIVITTCEAPLFVFSPKLQKVIPPLLHLRPREVAVDRERMELLGRRNATREELSHIYAEEWVVMTRSISILLTESRLIVFLFNLVSLALTVMILKDIAISNGTLALMLLGMLPYYVGFALTPILYVGKRLNLRDSDFRVALLGWLPPGWLSNRRVSQQVCPIVLGQGEMKRLPYPEQSESVEVEEERHIEAVIDEEQDHYFASESWSVVELYRDRDRDRDSFSDGFRDRDSDSGFSSVCLSEEEDSD